MLHDTLILLNVVRIIVTEHLNGGIVTKTHQLHWATPNKFPVFHPGNGFLMQVGGR